ncbi:hypothetical protein LQ327_22470 [Actinomycetospora endophytica]|uniref:Ig-like domain-containing protein n=1 Tax=Actinomycetospora endophytica TaxID=2291215 RepID=A0ABS8PD10_9PSEU|nr:hypothetical protein [Actinomycetospora endophytica]MCD2196141.1 hypothetical protein [Actinomycetospora endophytica]
MVNPAGSPPTFSSFRNTSVAGYTGGFIELDLGSLPAGDYSVLVTVEGSVASGTSPAETRDLFCVLDSVPASPLDQATQTTFPPLDSNGNAFTVMPMLGTLSTPDVVSLRLRCEVAPTTNPVDVQLTSRTVATATAPITQV